MRCIRYRTQLMLREQQPRQLSHKEHSELQDKICNMIIIKQFANNCPGFDVQFRPFFEKEDEEEGQILIN